MIRRNGLVAGLCGALVWQLIGGIAGEIAAVVVAVFVVRVLQRMETPTARRERLRIAAALPFVADLLAAALRAGAPTEHALRVIGLAFDDPLGHLMVRVAEGLRLGLEPDTAWQVLRRDPQTSRLADAIARSADSGAAISRSLGRLADSYRTEGIARVETAAGRAGILLVLPLGFCFLPAFVLAGIVPVVLAVLGGILK